MKFRHCFTLPVISAVTLMLNQCDPYATTIGPINGTQYLAGYGPQTGLPVSAGKPVYQPQGYWDGDGVHGTAKIRIVRAEQKAYFYKGGTLVGVTPISSGDSKHVTPAGRFKVTQKNIDHKSSTYGVIKNRATDETVNNNADIRLHKPGPGEYFKHAPMPNFMRFNHGIGMHTGFLPGYAASHGCVRMPDEMAQKFFQNAQVGTPVIVE
ncbi:MAG: L,D-transpeptidase family protein [Verrucomicrobiae bacterium]|nr:L,D-transpeptidase family protein [Verrucomicrobiae bacterium]NNJ43136.1 L,D-transpeptidase family protein [Akkermansiaceae bacterium]